MAHPGNPIDWQAMIALACVALAAAYLARRWWPGLRGLLRPVTSSSSAADGSGACGSKAQAQQGGAACGSGCGNCGQHATPAKDHRVHIVRHPTGTKAG